MPRRAVLPLLFALGASAATSFAAEPSKNPFLPKNTAGPAATSAHETIEFAGVSQIGKTTHLIFQDKLAKKNRWVGIGETVEGISVLNYDARLEQAVVKINGTQKTLALRKGTGPVSSNAATSVVPPPPAASFNVPPPTVAQTPQLGAMPPPAMPVDPAAQVASQPAGPKPASNTPEGQVKAETEARMLVSDLLEIGMAQRKAYEEQQRRAAEGKTGQPTPPAAPAPPQPR